VSKQKELVVGNIMVSREKEVSTRSLSLQHFKGVVFALVEKVKNW